MSSAARNLLLRRIFKIIPTITAVCAFLGWITDDAAGWSAWVMFGAILGTMLTVGLWRGDKKGYLRPRIIAGYLLACLGGLLLLENLNEPAEALTLQFVWGISYLISLIVLRILSAGFGRAVSKDQIATARQREIEHAQRIERQRKWQDRASGPGTITGFEPSKLETIELEDHPLMHGSPGAGLSGSGFGQRQVQLGQIGEENFARALQSQGLLQRFSTFWSVHMPDTVIGASNTFQSDIDCVLITSKSVWLIDVKNYVQGDVTWHRENLPDTGRANRERPHLIAVDNQTGGYVGKPRPMSQNMKLATERFTARMTKAGINFKVKPVVVMMPRDDGIGQLPKVTWPEQIPATDLSSLLSWLSTEQPFNAHNEDAQILSAMLGTLLKEESGSALRLGERPQTKDVKGKKTQTGTTAATQRAKPTSATNPPKSESSVPVPAAANSADNSTASGSEAPSADSETVPKGPNKKCASCEAEMEADWAFCYSCGA